MIMITRRKFFSGAAALVGGSALFKRIARGAEVVSGQSVSAVPSSNGNYPIVVTPNGSSLPWKMVDGVKEFRLVAEPVKREFAPGMVVNCWGYNGQTPGPTLEAVEGDRARGTGCCWSAAPHRKCSRWRDAHRQRSLHDARQSS